MYAGYCACQLLGLGIKTSITGKHADLVITDDIVNLNDRISPAERTRIKLAYNELQNIKNRNGRFINTGTPWHKEDAISMMPNVKKYDCYQTGLIGREKLEELRQKGLPTKLYSENTNKFIKIASYLKKEWSNIYFLEGTDVEYLDEILDYSETAAHDDCPDSAASIIRALTSKTKLHHVEGSL